MSNEKETTVHSSELCGAPKISARDAPLGGEPTVLPAPVVGRVHRRGGDVGRGSNAAVGLGSTGDMGGAAGIAVSGQGRCPTVSRKSSLRGGDHFPFFWGGIPHVNGNAVPYLIYTSLQAPTRRPPDPRLTPLRPNHPTARHPSTPTSARHHPCHPTAARHPPTTGGIWIPKRPGPARSVPMRSTPLVPHRSRPPATRRAPSRTLPATMSLGTPPEPTSPPTTRLWLAPASH